MNTTSLSQFVVKQDLFIQSFLNEDYDCCISLLDNQLYLMEADGDTSEPNKITKFLQWLKQNAWQKPRAWLAKMLTKLNTFAAKIEHKEETDPGKRGLWSKVKAAIAKAIVWITNKIENFVRPDEIGDDLNTNARSMNNKLLNTTIDASKETINANPENKRKLAHKAATYAFAAYAGEGEKRNKKIFLGINVFAKIDNILNEYYHVGDYGYDPEKGKEYGGGTKDHQKRLEMKKSGDVSGRKDAFWRDLIGATTSRLELDDMMGSFSDPKGHIATNFNKRMNQKYNYPEHNNTNPKLQNSATRDLLQSIHKDLGSDLETSLKSNRGTFSSDSLKDLLKQPDLSSKLSSTTKSKLLKFDKEYRASSRDANDQYKKQAENISNVVNSQEGTRTKEISNILDQSRAKTEEVKNDAQKNLDSIRNMKQDIEKAAENAPKSWLGKKVAALRKLYSEWLAKKNKEHDQKKIGFFSNILRLIAKCIDFLLKKLQNFAG